MKNILCSLCILLFISAAVPAQIKLIGVSYNTSTSSVDLLSWDLFDSTSLISSPTILDFYLYASSGFDPIGSNYYIAGIADQNSGLFSYNTDSGEGNLAISSSNTNIAEFDMSNSKMYNLIMEIEEYMNVYEYDILANEDSLIGTIYEPGVVGIVADAIGFDSNNGIIYYVGYTNDSELALYAIPVRNESFSFTKTILNTPNSLNSITSLHFDNINEKLFAANDVYNENGSFTGRNIVEIDINTGDVNTLIELSDFPYFVGSSSQFDQNSGTFLLVGINTNNEVKMIACDTYTNTYVTGYVPNVSEIVCDNTLFARSRYLINGIAAPTTSDLILFPNPVLDVLHIEHMSNGPLQLQIFSAMGEMVLNKNINYSSSISVDTSHLSKGFYIVKLIGENQSVTKAIVVE